MSLKNKLEIFLRYITLSCLHTRAPLKIDIYFVNIFRPILLPSSSSSLHLIPFEEVISGPTTNAFGPLRHEKKYLRCVGFGTCAAEFRYALLSCRVDFIMKRNSFPKMRAYFYAQAL
jgi:hypothetical protein